MTNEQAADYAAAKFCATRRKRTVGKAVSAVVAELLAVKEARGASARYLQDLRHRLNRFADNFQKDACNVTTAEIQEWLDSQKLKPQSDQNFRRVIHLLFEFAVGRGYASDNPVAVVESVEVRAGHVDIFTPGEISRLLAAASPDFLPCLTLGALAGLRPAEIERLEWRDIDFAGRPIVIGASKAKTASRRVVPITDNLAAWLAAYAGSQGNVWPGGDDKFYAAQQETAAATEVKADPEKRIKGEKPVKWKGERSAPFLRELSLRTDRGRGTRGGRTRQQRRSHPSPLPRTGQARRRGTLVWRETRRPGQRACAARHRHRMKRQGCAGKRR